MKDLILSFIRGIFGTKRLIKLSEKQQELSQFNLYELRRFQLIDHILHDTEEGTSSEKYADHEIIVSLTTYGKRIHDVAFTIESIMQQSMKANRIVLWLDYSFEGKQLPRYLQYQQKRGLEIAYCKDLRSYKKLIPALHRYPDAAIITVDDDVLYEPDLLEHLIVPYLENPHYIFCHRFHKISFDEKGQVLPYIQWQLHCKDEMPSHLNFATGVGGILYPPHSLDKEVTNEDVFMDKCKYADDIWFKAMAIKKGTLVKKVFSRTELSEDYLINAAVQDISLCQINTKGDMMNDKQFKAVFTKYNLYDKLQ